VKHPSAAHAIHHKETMTTIHSITPLATSLAPPDPSASPRRKHRAWLAPTLLMLLGAVAVLSAVVRLESMARALAMDVVPADHEDAHYLKHVVVVLLHLVPGIAFMVLGPLQFSSTVRRRWPAWHRWSGRVFVVCGFGVGLTSLWMNQFFPPVGGPLKYWANAVFGVALMVSLGISLAAIVRRDVALHRAWMVRAMAIGMGVATQRLYLVPPYLIYGELSEVAIGLGVWLGWGLNLAAAEIILLRERRRAQR